MAIDLLFFVFLRWMISSLLRIPTSTVLKNPSRNGKPTYLANIHHLKVKNPRFLASLLHHCGWGPGRKLTGSS